MGVSVGLVGGVFACGVLACNSDDSSGVPTGSGDNVTVDNDATVQPGPLPFDGGPDSPFARVEGSAYGSPDGYDPYGICQTCKCPATDYCFGGGGSYTTFDGNCMPTSFGIGCQPLPAGFLMAWCRSPPGHGPASRWPSLSVVAADVEPVAGRPARRLRQAGWTDPTA